MIKIEIDFAEVLSKAVNGIQLVADALTDVVTDVILEVQELVEGSDELDIDVELDETKPVVKPFILDPEAFTINAPDYSQNIDALRMYFFDRYS